MTNNSSVALAAIGVLATCVAGLIWVIKYLFQKILPVLEAQMAQSRATEKALLSVETAIQKLPKNITVKSANISEQHVEHQHVETINGTPQ